MEYCSFIRQDLKKVMVILRLCLFPAPKDSILPGFEAIFAAFENVGYIGELRQRWFEIKKLLKGGLQDNAQNIKLLSA